MSQTWICRPYRSGDETGILNLYREVFHLEMSPQLWHWMYQQSPAGPAIIIVLEHQGQVSGHYAVQPRDFSVAGRRCTAGFAVGTMLLPQVRSVDALYDMAQQAYLACRQRGFPWLYAFPNDQAHRVRCALLGWHALPEIVEWDGPLPGASEGATDRVGLWRKMPSSMDFERMFSSQAQRENSNPNRITSVRSTDWLKWRYFDRPDSEYVLHTIDDECGVAAYAVTKRYLRDGLRYGHLIEWRVTPNGVDYTTDLMASVFRQLAEWDVERVSCWARGQNELERPLANAGLSMTGSKTNFCYFDLDDCQREMLGKAEAWQVEMADSDRY